MKTKRLFIYIGALVLASALWFGRDLWRTHHQLVTLRVRNMPLREVLAKVERQTNTKIVPEQNVDARITLNVKNKPLSYVLNRVAEQAGARWVTLHGVYNSKAALRKLKVALRQDGKIEAAGWNKIAPDIGPTRFAGGMPPAGSHFDGPHAAVQEAHASPPGMVTESEDVVVRGSSRAPAEAGQVNEARPKRVMVVRRGGPGGDRAEEEVWTPEELLLQADLSGRLGKQRAEDASPETARAIAEKVAGDWTSYIVLRKSRIPLGFGGGSSVRTGRIRVGGEPGKGDAVPGHPGVNAPPDIPPNLEADLQQQRYAEFGRLTPEQRVQRARERQKVSLQSN